MKPRIPHPTQSKLFYVKGDAKTILSPELRRYGDYANFIQHRIIVGRMLWQVDDKTERYTILKSDILRQYIPKLIMKKMLKTYNLL